MSYCVSKVYSYCYFQNRCLFKKAIVNQDQEEEEEIQLIQHSFSRHSSMRKLISTNPTRTASIGKITVIDEIKPSFLLLFLLMN